MEVELTRTGMVLTDILKNLNTADLHTVSTLPSLDEYELKRAQWYNEKEGALNARDGVDCPLCKNKGQIAVYTPEQGQFMEICKCMKMRESVQLMKRSGLDGSIKKFEDFETYEKWQKIIKNKAMDFPKQTDARCFYIGGQSGAGKTHLCTAIAREYLVKCLPVRYIVWVQAVEQMKSYDNMFRFEQSDEWANVDVLYIDDFFKPAGGAFSGTDIRKTFEIIDRRYKQPDKITIISSELTLDEIGRIDQATAGRIFETAGHGGFVLTIPKGQGYNYRINGGKF